MKTRYRVAAALGLLAATALPAAAQDGGEVPPRNPLPSGVMSVLYTANDETRVLTAPGGPGPALGGDRGVFRQDPGPGGVFDPHGRNGDFRIGKVNARDLVGLSAEEMAALIRRESDDPVVPNNTGLVAVDEIGNAFNDGRIRIEYRWVTVRGKRYRIASHNKIVLTRTGWKLVRGRAALPPVPPDSLGSRFSEAMRILAETPHPAGGSYAERVHVCIAPAFGSSVGVGRGPHRHLGPDGKPHRATWRGVMPGVARAGGIWIEMYHFDGRALGNMSAGLWRAIPQGFGNYAARFGADRSRMRFLMSGAPNIPAGAPRGCGNAMSCQWALARSTPAGRAILANGVGAYRTGAFSRTFRAEFNRTFG
jgi:hypothetical protein